MKDMTLEQAMYELRKANKGLRKTERRLAIAEGIIQSSVTWLDDGQIDRARNILSDAIKFQRLESVRKKYIDYIDNKLEDYR